MIDPITSQSVRVGFPESGPNRSETIQTFADKAVYDIQNLTRSNNLLAGESQMTNELLLGEVAYLRTGLRTLEAAQESQQANAEKVIASLDFYDKKKVSFAPNTPEQNKLVVNQRYGQVYLPTVNSTPVFYNEDKKTGTVYPNRNISIEVTPINEPVSGGTLPLVDIGKSENAFNGHNNSTWIRNVRYPLESPINSVSVQLDVTLPQSVGDTRFNVVQAHPFPVDRCDILGIWYKPTHTSPFILLENFPQSVKGGDPDPTPDPIENADLIQLFGQLKTVAAFRIQLRQRNWTETGNQKVFTYGLQELNVKLEEFSTINSSYSPDLSQCNHVVYKVDAPDNTIFKSVTGIYADPLLNLETSIKDSNHCVVYLSKTPNLDSPQDVLWTSYNSQLPQNSTSTIDLTIPIQQSTYYVIIMIKYVFTLKSASSPFQPGMTPVLNAIRMVHSVEALGGAEANTVIDNVDWYSRNWALHTQFVSHMDVYRGAVADGSNILVFGDDFYSEPAWRAALTATPLDGVVISNKLMSLTTNNNASNSSGVIEYDAINSTLWEDAWQAKRFRIQMVADIPSGGASVTFYFNYITDQGPQFRIEIDGSQSATWVTLPDDVGDLTSFSLSIKLTNSNVGGLQPMLGQFILLLKD